MAPAEAAGFSARRHVSVDILADSAAVRPGQTVTVAVRERIEPEWHTYWINPGDSGEPTSVEWTLPEGVTAGPILWPAPNIISIGPLVNYGYENEVLLLTEIKVPENAAAGNLAIAGKVRYLVCKDVCVPEEADVALTLPVGEKAEPSEFAGQIDKARRALAAPLPGSASYALIPGTETLRLSIGVPDALLTELTEARFFPSEWGPVSNAAPQPKQISGGRLILDLKQGEEKGTPEKLDGLLVLTKGAGEGGRTGYLVSAERVANAAPGGGKASNASTPGSSGKAVQPHANGSGAQLQGIGLAALFAFLGGLILNLMPCVFPVLALKALSFASANAGGHRRQGASYLAGVLVSFALLAAIIAVLREGGAALGWGFQFQSPVFVLILAVLFFTLGLSLSGVVSFGGGLMSAGDSLTRKQGNAGYFFTGVLATVAATPCTAPFMGAAIGYAMTQPAPALVAILLALGLGFATPVFVLSWSPHLQHVLPKPGHWMETLKQVLAFPLYATAGWLIWVLSLQIGSDGVLAAALVLVGVGFAAWLAGKTAFSSLAVRLIAPTIAIAAIASGVSMSIKAENGGADAAGAVTSILKEEPFSQARLNALQAEGRPVFVNLTAAWCITCKVNERLALKSSVIADAFQSAGIVYLKGDWTKGNPEITALLQHFGRAGVPLYIFYPGRGAEPRVLPQILTEGLVLDEIKTLSASTITPPAKGA